MTAVDTYSLHGLGLRMQCDVAAVHDAIRARLLPYAVPLTDGAAASTAHSSFVEFRIARGGRLFETAPTGRPVYDTEIADVVYDDATDTLTIDASSQVQVIAELRDKRVRMSLLSDDPAASALCAHPLLTLCVLELMKRAGRYPLHAGGVAVGADAVLLPGASGAGKSTLTAALLQLDTGFLSDDIVFLTPDDRGVEVFSFADQLDVTDSTAAMFPELSDLVGAPLPPGRPKHQVRAETRFGRARVDRARPAAIVMPSISADSGSTLREADGAVLLAHLAPNVLLTDVASSQRHLEALAAVVDSVPAYHLAVGSDLGGAARLVLSLIA